MANENNQRGGSGNFANDHERASEAGRKGGQQSHQGSADSGSKSQPGGSSKTGGQQDGNSGTFADNPDKAREAGRKGGEHSHGKS